MVVPLLQNGGLHKGDALACHQSLSLQASKDEIACPSL